MRINCPGALCTKQTSCFLTATLILSSNFRLKVGTALCYGLEVPRLKFRQGKTFLHSLWSTQPPVQLTWLIPWLQGGQGLKLLAPTLRINRATPPLPICLHGTHRKKNFIFTAMSSKWSSIFKLPYQTLQFQNIDIKIILTTCVYSFAPS
jgi:hypothetical protein